MSIDPRGDRYCIVLSHHAVTISQQWFIVGVVVGVDEESACCWLACDTCGNADLTVKQEARYVQYSCGQAVSGVERACSETDDGNEDGTLSFNEQYTMAEEQTVERSG